VCQRGDVEEEAEAGCEFVVLNSRHTLVSQDSDNAIITCAADPGRPR
jgi:hypothetical protein